MVWFILLEFFLTNEIQSRKFERADRLFFNLIQKSVHFVIPLKITIFALLNFMSCRKENIK